MLPEQIPVKRGQPVVLRQQILFDGDLPTGFRQFMLVVMIMVVVMLSFGRCAAAIDTHVSRSPFP